MSANVNIGGGRAVTRCRQCGLVDDHPKVVLYDGKDDTQRWHHDCLPFELRQLVDGSPAGGVVAAAVGGLRGADLLNAIQTETKGA